MLLVSKEKEARHMGQIYTQTSLSLNEKDTKRVEKLKRLNIKIIEIFRLGLATMERKKK